MTWCHATDWLDIFINEQSNRRTCWSSKSVCFSLKTRLFELFRTSFKLNEDLQPLISWWKIACCVSAVLWFSLFTFFYILHLHWPLHLKKTKTNESWRNMNRDGMNWWRLTSRRLAENTTEERAKTENCWVIVEVRVQVIC